MIKRDNDFSRLIEKQGEEEEVEMKTTNRRNICFALYLFVAFVCVSLTVSPEPNTAHQRHSIRPENDSFLSDDDDDFFPLLFFLVRRDASYNCNNLSNFLSVRYICTLFVPLYPQSFANAQPRVATYSRHICDGMLLCVLFPFSSIQSPFLETQRKKTKHLSNLYNELFNN